jgi:hypothetical protein
MNGSENVKGDGMRHGDCASTHGHVDVWLRDALASTYDAVLAEPLPESWVRLIRRAPALESER